MQWEMLLSDVGQFVISFSQWTSTFAVRLPANCASPMSNNWWPTLLRCYLGTKLKLAFGKLFRPWWNREEFQSYTSSQTNPRHSLEPNQQLNVTFCAAIRWCYLIALLSMPTCAPLEGMADVTTAVFVCKYGPTFVKFCQSDCLAMMYFHAATLRPFMRNMHQILRQFNIHWVIKSSAYLRCVSRSWWPMAVPQKNLQNSSGTMDVHFRRLLRCVVGPPSQTNWLNPWHEILHDWNARVARYVQDAGVLTWSQRSLQQYRHLCSYIAGLPDVRWVSRTVAWRPRNIRKRGAPFRMWHSAAETFCRWKGIANWQTAAMNTQNWYKHTSDFCSFIFQSWSGLC